MSEAVQPPDNADERPAPDDAGTAADAAGGADDTRRIARRALLRRAAYVVPAVLGTIAVSRNAAAQASCMPVCTCQPDCCFPDIDCPPWFDQSS